MADKRDYYDVLGVGKTANEEEIKKSYRGLAKKYHPDVSTEPNAEEKFKEVQEAYDCLSDSQKRSQYDQFGHDGPQMGGFEGFSGGFSDIFSSFFGGGSRQSSRGGVRKGDDIERLMVLEFEEAVLGCKKKFNVTVSETCTTCAGSGAYSKNDVVTCGRCQGSGSVVVEQRTIFGMSRTQTVCPKCGGRGQEIKKKCEKCSGSGYNSVNKNIEVKIPAGVDTGLQLRVEGKGGPGLYGGEPGDLYLRFRVKPHKVFKRDDTTIILDVPLSFSKATLGTSIDVPTIHGEVKLKIPAGTQSGTRFKLREKGCADVRTGRLGDQIVVVNLVTPTTLTVEEKKIYEQLDNIEVKQKKSPWERFKAKFNK